MFGLLQDINNPWLAICRTQQHLIQQGIFKLLRQDDSVRPVPESFRLAVAGPGVAVEVEAVDDGEHVLDPVDPSQEVVVEVEPLQPRKAGEGPGLELGDPASAEVHLDQPGHEGEGGLWHRVYRVIPQREAGQVRRRGERGAGDLV